MTNKINLALLNIMPNAIEYEALVRAALADVADDIVLHPARLATHQYQSSGERISRYPTFGQLVAEVTPDLLIITGAPVEHLPYEQISYWNELCSIIDYGRQHVKAVMGVCFGGLAVAKYLGVDKRLSNEKLFGVVPVHFTAHAAPYLAQAGSGFDLPLSTWALLDRAQLAAAGDTLLSVVEHAELGPLVLESPDRRFCIVLGHPEYEAATLRKEWERDRAHDIPYTRRFQASDFDMLAQGLAATAPALLSRWVASHAVQLRPLFSVPVASDTP